MQWLVAVLAKVGLEWIYGKVVVWGQMIIAYFKEQDKRDEIKDGRQAMARTVEEISAEIRRLMAAGEPIPEELKQELRNAARKLVNYSLD